MAKVHKNKTKNAELRKIVKETKLASANLCKK